MKLNNKSVRLSSLVVGVLSLILFMQVDVVRAADPEAGYPTATIKITDSKGNSGKKLEICPGETVTYTVTGSFGTVGDGNKFSRVYLRKLDTDGNLKIGGGNTSNLSGSVPTDQLKAGGQYAIYPMLNSGLWACEGSPYCRRFCERPELSGRAKSWQEVTGGDSPGGPVSCAKDKVDGGSCQTLADWTSPDIYRTSGYPPNPEVNYPGYCKGYTDDSFRPVDTSCVCSGTSIGGAGSGATMSCGEGAVVYGVTGNNKSCSDRCEVTACDREGYADHAFIFVKSDCKGGSSSGGGSGGTGGNGGGGAAGGTGGTTNTEVTLSVTNKAGQVKSTDTKLDLKGKILNVSAGVKSLTNNEFIDSALQTRIGSGVVVGTKTLQLTKAVNVITGNGDLVLVNSDVGVSASIPDGTTVLGTDSWGGNLKIVPVAVAGGDVPVGFKVKGQVVEMGSSDSSLVFSKPVAVDFGSAECDWSQPGDKVTCDVAYKSVGQDSWTNIPRCSSEVEKDSANLEFAKECYVPKDTSKTVRILTYHFSQFASFKVDQPASYLMALPQVCMEKMDPSKMLLQFQFGVNPAYGSFIQAFTKCSSRTNCSGSEQLLTGWKTVEPNQKVIDSVPVVSSIYGIKEGDILKFRVGGTLKGGTTPANIADLADKYWSEPVFKRVSSCENRGGGITIEELIISPQRDR